MEVVQVAQYESDLSDEVVEENNDLNQNKNVKKKRRSKHWVKEATFDNAEEAEESIENIWSKQYTNYIDHGRRVYYRCNKAKLRGPQCSASIHLLYHADSDQVTVYKTEGEHDHHDEKVRGIDENVKKCIEELYNDEQWCEGNVEVPIDENKAFAVSYKILYDNEEYEDNEDIEEDGNKFHIFISSVRLLNIASISSHLHADATYKLVWQGFPVLIVGTTDFNKAVHPFGLAVCSNETIKDFEFIFNSIQVGMQKINKDLLKPTALISDAADAIKNGFTNIFGSSYNQIMCWAHMKRKVNNRVCQIDDKHIAKEIIEDIEMLQLSNSTEVFKLASTLFVKKWNMNNKQKNESILDFMNYFYNEWLKTNDGWYEGIQVYTPSTNNALEATNRTIKDDGTFRERHILSRFLTIASNIVNNWSIERDITSIKGKIFATEPTISLELWTLSYQWAKSTKDIICISNDSSKTYYIPARDLQSISQASLNKYKNKTWSTFNQFTKSFDIWCMEMDNGSDWRKSKCSCPGFFKNYICKHVVGMAIRLKYCKPPPSAKTVPIGEK
ncbi:unnamed protein product [Rotaria sp. Silwood2]|nr:unnamed protein product [Rotaria sp. Silwood2]